jgi:hypothetical protein
MARSIELPIGVIEIVLHDDRPAPRIDSQICADSCMSDVSVCPIGATSAEK